jgi:hypothetical protein
MLPLPYCIFFFSNRQSNKRILIISNNNTHDDLEDHVQGGEVERIISESSPVGDADNCHKDNVTDGW